MSTSLDGNSAVRYRPKTMAVHHIVDRQVAASPSGEMSDLAFYTPPETLLRWQVIGRSPNSAFVTRHWRAVRLGSASGNALSEYGLSLTPRDVKWLMQTSTLTTCVTS